MLAPCPAISIGSPRFSDPKLAKLASIHGDIAAWTEAVATRPGDAAARVLGNFAVGLTRPNGSVFIAVDRFATHSMCYREVNGQLRFAARVDELVDGSSEVDPQAIFDYLYFHVIPSPRTIYKDIYRVPPGHYALYEDGRLTVAPYWAAHFEEPGNVSFEGLKVQFRDLLLQSVTQQLDGSKPACFLSGGTDSSTVAGMAAKSSGQAVATYSIGFDAAGYDEMEYARIAAKHFNTEHHEYYVTPGDLVSSIPALAAHFDQPFGNSSALPSYYCAKMAVDDGVSKVLAGDGGDELFGGNSRYAKQRVFGWYRHVPAPLQRGLLEPVLRIPALGNLGLARKAASYVEQARVPMPDRLQMYNLIMRLGPQEVLTPQLLAQVDTSSPLRLQQAVWKGALATGPLNRELAFDWRFTLAESDLPKVMGATSLAKLAVGFPMLDDRLLAFSQTLPVNYKVRGLKLRWFFKEALRGFLPDEIISKRKQGFGLPFGVWANSHAGLKDLASVSLNSLAARGIVRADFVHTLITQRLPEHPAYFGEMVWILMMLEQWLQRHVPGLQFKN